MTPDLINFIHENGLKLMLDVKGWKYSSSIIIDGLAVVKPDFYPNYYKLALGKKGYIYAEGHSRIEYAGRVFNSTEELLSVCGEDSIHNFQDWVFLEEKEWVITDGENWLVSFTDLTQLPNRKKYRC